MHAVYVLEHSIALLICYMTQSERTQNADVASQNKLQAKLTSDNAQWYYVDNYMGETELIEYPDNINLIIEKAYCNKDKEVRFQYDGGTEYAINFNNMTEHPTVDKTDITTVIRRVKTKGFYDYCYYHHVLVIKYHD